MNIEEILDDMDDLLDRSRPIPFAAHKAVIDADRMRELLNSDRYVGDIALDHGFADARAFAKAFKKRYGCLPSQYRKQMNQKQVNQKQMNQKQANQKQRNRKSLAGE